MKTYLRILAYAKPWGKIIPPYLLFSLLSILFGLANLTLLKPLFDVIFEQLDPEQLDRFVQKPEFSLTIEYINNIFNYYMYQMVEMYGKFGALVYVCLIIMVSFLLTNLFRYLSAMIMAVSKAKVIRNMRYDIFQKVSNLHIGYFTSQRKGDIMSRVTSDVQQIENSVVHTLKIFFREPATIIVYFGLLFATSKSLTLFTLLLLPVSGVFITIISKKLKKRATQGQESQGRMLNILDETLSGMRVIKAFNAVGYINRVFGREVDRYYEVDMSFSRRYEMASPVSEFLGAISVTGILLYGGHLVLNKGTLEASSFLMFIAVFTQVLQPAKAITSAISFFQKGLASGDRVFHIIDTRSEIENKPDAVQLTSFESAIEFKNVHFSYGERPVLNDVNLRIEKGTTVAVVGPSGGGKSTLANLIPRFYDPTGGDVLIDGRSLRDYDFNSLREHMGIVTQESILFNDTIFNNIAFGISEPREEDVLHAAKIANAHNFIMEHEEGYQRVIGERGGKLSGGQKQRITIARALLKNPPILILDEATSALDSESEMLVQDAIDKLMKNRTSVVIAHRLSTIQNADEIIVMDQGKILERGTHTSLIRQGGIYQKLTSMQNL
jgi:subfamily B ATP-binding cassette protein MsbA